MKITAIVKTLGFVQIMGEIVDAKKNFYKVKVRSAKAILTSDAIMNTLGNDYAKFLNETHDVIDIRKNSAKISKQ